MGKKVSELSGAELDFWVAKAEGYAFKLYSASESGERRYAVSVPGEKTLSCARLVNNAWLENVPKFSSDWSQGGPIIEREKIRFGDDYDLKAMRWAVFAYFAYIGIEKPSYGDSVLEAAMRCYVTSEFGEEVQDET